MNKEKMLVALKELKNKKTKTSDFMEQMSIADEIHNIEMKLNGVKPTDSSIDCIGCGS
jgi:formate hydrogenlyase subunit 6/NADH:ubiquinone oxidoreductase subunit I